MAESEVRSLIPRYEFPDGELGTSAMLGDITDRSVRVWLREPAGEATARLLVGGELLAEETIRTDRARDNIGAAVLQLDAPRPSSAFQVRVGGLVRTAQFAPAPGSQATFTFAFGSCHEPFTEVAGGRVEKHPGAAIYPRLRTMLAERGARFAVWLGDQVYSDSIAGLDIRKKLTEEGTVTDTELLEGYRHLYRGFFGESGFRALAEELPAYLMWDDHDIVDGWGSVPPWGELDRRLYAAAERAFIEYQALRNPGGVLDAAAPFDFSFWRGDVGFHVADLRSQRNWEAEQVMGEAGWGRLDAFLAEATAREVPTVFLGLSIPLVHASPALMRALESMQVSIGRDVRDRWSVTHFAQERRRMVERIFAWQSADPRRQVIVLSGDVHVGAAFNVKPKAGAGRFAQWTSSALSTPDGLRHVVANEVITKFVRAGESELRVWRRGLATSNNCGVVEVEPAEGGGHRVRLAVYEYDARHDSLRPALKDLAVPDSARRA